MTSAKLLVAFSLSLLGCTSLFMGHADETEVTAAELTTKACPLGVPSTRVHIADTKNGVDVLFSTTMAHVDDLRGRVRDQSASSGPNRHVGAGHDGRHGGNHDHGLQLWSMGELETRVEDTPNGAKLSIAPVDPSRRDDVRKRVIERVAQLEANGCHE